MKPNKILLRLGQSHRRSPHFSLETMVPIVTIKGDMNSAENDC